MFKVKSVEKLKSGDYCCEYYVYSNTSYELLNAVDLCDHGRIRVYLDEEDEDVMIPFLLWNLSSLGDTSFTQELLPLLLFSFDDEKENRILPPVLF